MEEPLMDFQLSFDDGPEHPPTGAFFGPNHMAAKVYQLSPQEVSTINISKKTSNFMICVKLDDSR